MSDAYINYNVRTYRATQVICDFVLQAGLEFLESHCIVEIFCFVLYTYGVLKMYSNVLTEVGRHCSYP